MVGLIILMLAILASLVLVGLIILMLAILASLVWLWAGGIDYMRENHPDYKGYDLFDEEDKNHIT